MSIGFFRQALNALRKQSPSRTSYRVNQWFKWLSPGLAVKRWFLISVGGVILTILGLAIWIKLTPIFWMIKLVRRFLGVITDLLPNYVSGPLCCLAAYYWCFGDKLAP
jgi:hypothetical protein